MNEQIRPNSNSSIDSPASMFNFSNSNLNPPTSLEMFNNSKYQPTFDSSLTGNASEDLSPSSSVTNQKQQHNVISIEYQSTSSNTTFENGVQTEIISNTTAK